MRFTVRAPIEEVAQVAVYADCDCDLIEDDDAVTIVEMHDEPTSRFVRVLSKLGYVWHMGIPKLAHADPTFARAAQHVDGADRMVRGGTVL